MNISLDDVEEILTRKRYLSTGLFTQETYQKDLKYKVYVDLHNLQIKAMK